MLSSLIKLVGVDLSLGRGAARVHILRGISLEVGRGEALGLVGPSGSGKSSLLMAIAGLERVDAGTVEIDGEDLARLDEETGAQIADLIFGLRRERGATLVLVTHDLPLARRCDRIVRMHSGLVEAAASPVA